MDVQNIKLQVGGSLVKANDLFEILSGLQELQYGNSNLFVIFLRDDQVMTRSLDAKEIGCWK